MTYDSNDRRISEFKNLSKNDNHFTQTNKLEKAFLQAPKYITVYSHTMYFDSVRDHMNSQIPFYSDANKFTSIYMVYALESITHGMHVLIMNDSSDNNKLQGLIINRSYNHYLTVYGVERSGFNGFQPEDTFPIKASPIELKKTIILSVHYDYRTGNTNRSHVFCNGKEIIQFTAHKLDLSSSTNIINIGSRNGTNKCANFELAMLGVVHNVQKFPEILNIHRVLSKVFNVDVDESAFNYL